MKLQADFLGAAKGLPGAPKLELQLPHSDSDHGGIENGECGHTVLLSEEEIETMNFKILAATTDRPLSFIIQAEQPIELLFFRRIFTRLREQKARANEISGRSTSELGEDLDENIPIQAFQRAMGRLFYVLRDPQGFDSKVYDLNGNNYVGWGEFCYVWKDRQITVRLSLCERIYLTFDDPQSSYLARLVSMFTLSTIVISSLGFIMSTMPEFQEKPSDGSAPTPVAAFDLIEYSCLIIFVLEYLVRVGTCWAIREEVFDKAALLELATGYERIQLNSPVVRLMKFVFNLQNLIDLAAILPGVIEILTWLISGEESAGGGGFVVLRLIRLTRIFRAFRLGKYVEPVLVITRTVKQSTKALYVLAFNLLLGVVIFGSLMYLMEQGDWDEKSHEYLRVVDTKWNETLQDYEKVVEVTPFKSIPHAFWWALVTSTTVGYGDHYPTSSMGKYVAVVCMVWSLVILALPVGVIGGTFTQVWDDFGKNKKKEALLLRRDMMYVAGAIQRIEPAKVSRILLLQVWNDDGQYEAMPASPEDFMGEVKLELELPPDAVLRGREMRLKLQANHSVVRKEINGNITVRYDWFPHEPAKTINPEGGEYRAPTAKSLHGALRLEVVSASDLINTDWGRYYGRSSPYVVALCYPQSPAPEAPLVPVVWRSPTAHHSLNPVWQCGHTFQYLWYVPVDTAEYRSRACRRVMSTRSLGRVTGDNSGSSVGSRGFKEPSASNGGSPVRPFHPPSESPSPDEVMNMLSQLTSSMPRLTSSLMQMQQQVSNLSGRVDGLSSSLGPGSGSSLKAGLGGSGRPSHELRAVARGDPVACSGLSLQPGPRTRSPWDRSDVEDSIDEPGYPGISNGGLPGAHAGDMAAGAAPFLPGVPAGPGG